MFDTAAIGKHEFTALQNYELIGSGTPFPFDRLTSLDAVVYSPIRNKGEWNTSILQEKCDALGVRTVSYPWLQWNGYFPDVGDAPAPHHWTYNRLAQMAQSGATLDEMRDLARDPDGFDPINYLEYAFKALSEHESDLDFQIGEFIRRHYQEHRLFWTPDHPTLALYAHVQKRIAQQLGIWINGFARHDEPHSDALIILPGVEQSLGLKFEGPVYRLEGATTPADLDQFLALTSHLFSEQALPAG